MVRDGRGLPKVSSGPAMPYSSTPVGRATPETASWPFQRWLAHRAGGLQSSSTPSDSPSPTPLIPFVYETRSRSTSSCRHSPSLLPRQAASVESSTSSTSGRGSIKVSSSPHPSPPRVKRGESILFMNFRCACHIPLHSQG
jgi:hypothetical protein